MSRAFPVWLLASALCAFVGCGGDDATDAGAGAVAETSTPAAPAGGGGAAMPSGGAGMAAPESSGMGSASGNAMMGAAGGAGMDAGMYGSSAGSSADPAAATNPGGSTSDMAAMQAAYATGEGPGGAAGGYPGGTDPAATGTLGGYPGGTDPAAAGEAGAYPGSTNPAAAGTAGAYPGSTNPSATGVAGAYPGGEYPGSGLGGPGGAVEEKVPDGFDGKAQLAFRRGKEKDAIQYLYAHALTTDAGAESLLPTIRWVGGLRQPKLAVRWGAGFIVTAPRNFTGDPKPIGSQQTIPTRDGKRKGGGGNEAYVGGGGGAEYGAGGGSVGGSGSLLSKGAGELGDKLAAAYSERVMQGDFGEVLKTATEGSSGGNRGNSGGDGTAGYGAAGGAGFGAKGGAEGMVAGAGGAGGLGGGGGVGGGGGGGATAAAATQVTQLMPGLSMLGVGTQKELIERAREDGIDVVVIIDVKIRVSPSNLVTNDTTLALFDAKTQQKFLTKDKKPIATKAFNNIAIQKARAEEKEDGVDQELEKLFASIDDNFKMADLPAALNANRATLRVAELAAETHDNPLPVLAEARMYHAKGLLEESALFAAYEKILGVDSGRLLATGSEEDKTKALDRWLPES